jgi:hypothetical protein
LSLLSNSLNSSIKSSETTHTLQPFFEKLLHFIKPAFPPPIITIFVFFEIREI